MRAELGDRIKDRRKLVGLTQTEVSERMDALGHPMHQTVLSKLESGDRPTTVEELVALGWVLACDPANLLSGLTP